MPLAMHFDVFWRGGDSFEKKVEQTLLHIIRNQEKMEMAYEQLIADIHKNSSLSQSLMDALAANAKTMKDALAQVPSSTDTSALQQALQEIEQNNQKMAAAVLANTPAQETTSQDQIVKNDGPTDAQNESKTGMVDATQGKDTAGLKGPGPDQAPAAQKVDQPS